MGQMGLVSLGTACHPLRFSRGRRADFKPGETSFEGARVASAAEADSVWPPGWTTQPDQPDNGEDPAFRYLNRPGFGGDSNP